MVLYIGQKNDFVPLLERHRFSKGSLSHTSLENEIEHTGVHLNPLPPLFETILEPNDLLILRNAVSIAGITTEEFEILPLIKRCSSIRINGYTLGSCKSILRSNDFTAIPFCCYFLAEIQYFFCLLWWCG